MSQEGALTSETSDSQFYISQEETGSDEEEPSASISIETDSPEPSEPSEPSKTPFLDATVNFILDYWKYLLVGLLIGLLFLGLFVFLIVFFTSNKSTVVSSNTTSAVPIITTVLTRSTEMSTVTTVTPVSTTVGTTNTPKPHVYPPADPQNLCLTEGFSLVNKKCVLLVNTPETHTNASAKCDSYLPASLPVIKNSQENDDLADYMAANNLKKMWLGLQCDGNDESSCQWDYKQGDLTGYSNFADGHPNVIFGKCVFYLLDLKQWGSGDCEVDSLPYICEMSTTSECTIGTSYNHYCYIPDQLDTTYSQAIQQCKDLCASLVSIHSEMENRVVASFFGVSRHNGWLGGVAPAADMVMWNDGSPRDYNNIVLYDKNTICIYIRFIRGGWYSEACNATAWYRLGPVQNEPIQSDNEIESAPEAPEPEGEAKTEFEPAEKQRHFGILQYTMNNRFRKIMLIGLANVLLIVAFFLFMFFFVVKVKCAEPEITTTLPPSTTTMVQGSTTPAGPPLKYICADGFDLVFGKCWQINIDLPGHQGAEQICNTRGSTLFTIKSELEDQAFRAWMNHRHHRSWMGLTCESSDNTTCVWDDGEKWPFSYVAFEDGSPADDCCFQYNISGVLGKQWTCDNCGLPLSYVCELPQTIKANCTNNFNMHCYNYYSQPKSLTDAQDYCREHDHGNLLSVQSRPENIYVQAIQGIDSDYIWLGGFAASRSFVSWMDGTPMNYNGLSATGDYNEKESCLLMKIGGNWTTTECSKSFSFICKVPIPLR